MEVLVLILMGIVTIGGLYRIVWDEIRQSRQADAKLPSPQSNKGPTSAQIRPDCHTISDVDARTWQQLSKNCQEYIVCKILVIEDDPDMVMALRMPLEANNYEVTAASTCEEGLQMVKDILPDLIILDVMMRTLAAGFRLLLQLRNPHPRSKYAAYRRIPILMLTRLQTTTFLRFYPHRGDLSVDGIVGNPVDHDELLAKVQSLIKR